MMAIHLNREKFPPNNAKFCHLQKKKKLLVNKKEAAEPIIAGKGLPKRKNW